MFLARYTKNKSLPHIPLINLIFTNNKKRKYEIKEESNNVANPLCIEVGEKIKEGVIS